MLPKLYARLVYALRRRYENVIDRLTIILFVRLTSQAPLGILRILYRELIAQMKRRLAEEIAEAKRQQPPTV